MALGYDGKLYILAFDHRGFSRSRCSESVAIRLDRLSGFAIGRSIWWDALKGFLAEEIDREAAVQIAQNFLYFVGVYERQHVH